MVPEHVTIRQGDADLSVRLWSKNGEPVVMLHGGPGMPDYLIPVARMLHRDAAVITYDQRGAGRSRSRAPVFGLQKHIDDLAFLVRKLGLAPFHLFGHSWGGLLAQLYCQQHPGTVKSLFLCNAMTGVGRDFVRMGLHLLKHYHQAADPPGWLKMETGFMLLALPGALGDFGARVLYRQIWRNFFAFSFLKPKINGHWLRGVYGHAVRRTLFDLLATPASRLNPSALAPHVPVLALYGERDVFGPEYQTVFRRYPRARKEIMPGCGHIPWAQNPIAFALLLDDFYTPTLHKESSGNWHCIASCDEHCLKKRKKMDGADQ